MSGVRDTSFLAFYNKVRRGLGPDEQRIFELLLELGPMHDRRLLEAMNQRELATLKPRHQKRIWDINQITARRNGLLGKGAIEDLGAHRGIWHGQKKVYHIWRIKHDQRESVGWAKVSIKQLPPPRKNPAEIRWQREDRTRRAERPILQKLAASEAGRTLAEYRHIKGRKQTIRTEQGILFA